MPHSEISGSKIALISPELFAECHVLHRLYAPRHSPDALTSLERESSMRRIDKNPTHGKYSVTPTAKQVACSCQNSHPIHDKKHRHEQRGIKHRSTMSNNQPQNFRPKTKTRPFPRQRLNTHNTQTPGAWWRRSGSNRRPVACKATALPTELRPRSSNAKWWARVDLNYRPHAYQACALTN